jgi:hypothetical protein
MYYILRKRKYEKKNLSKLLFIQIFLFEETAYNYQSNEQIIKLARRWGGSATLVLLCKSKILFATDGQDTNCKIAPA